MKSLRGILVIGLVAVGLAFTSPIAFAQSSKDEEKLRKVSIALSMNSAKQIRDYLTREDSGYPELTRHLLTILKGARPVGEPTYLDAIMGRYREVNGKKSSDYIAPPYQVEKVREAFVINWRENNAAGWSSMSESIQADYRQAFRQIAFQGAK